MLQGPEALQALHYPEPVEQCEACRWWVRCNARRRQDDHLSFIAGGQTSTLMFRLDQLDAAEDFGEELVLRFDERDGVAKTARLTPNGLEVELFHILTYT